VTSKSYDATVKALVETDPASWPALLGRPRGPTTVIDADIATVSGAADKVLHVSAQAPYLLHLEFVSGHDAAEQPRKLHVRNGLLEDRHDLGVRSALILLHPGADSPQVTGLYERGFPDEPPYLSFRYQVVRVWQVPPELLLRGGTALLPFAPISAVTEAELPGIIQQIDERLSRRAARQQAEVVRAAAYVLMGLRWPPAVIEPLFRGVQSMKESWTYQAILAEGREEGRDEGAVVEAKKLLRIQGDDAFGPPDARTAKVIEQIADLARLEELFKRLRSANNWRELLGPLAPEPRKGRRRQTP
jgi:hypothetical protein